MDMPVLSMILRSGWLAKCILIFLAVFSVLSWAIIFNRFFYFRRINRLNTVYKNGFDATQSLEHMGAMERKLEQSPLGKLGSSLAAEYKRILSDAQIHMGVKDWSFYLQNQFIMVQERLNATAASVNQQLDRGLILLAIVSSAAPFFGLLGTVWGIMNSFFEIANQGSASLPVVAPGIAEALITTFAGLAVAIPAIIFYNWFVHRVERIQEHMDAFAEQLLLRLKHELFNVLYSENQGR